MKSISAHKPRKIGERSAKSTNYKDKAFRSLKGRGFKANYYEVSTGEEYWISGCKTEGSNGLVRGTKTE